MSTTQMPFPETLREAIIYFADVHRALEFMVTLKWPDGVVRCPHCESANVGFLEKRCVWKCRGCRKQFSPKVGTVFEDSPLPLSKWLPALWSIVNAKNGISSCELHRALGVTQKTAWFMLQRIRLAMQSGEMVRTMSGTVEVDESYIGGAARNMHHKVKIKRGMIGATGPVGKSIVLGILERGEKGKKVSRIAAEVVTGTTGKEMMPHVRKYVLKGTELHTDALRTYREAAADFEHKVVDHAETYVKDGVHTNGLENFWSLLKRTIKGTYVSVEPFHLFRYLSEQVFRFNERKDKDGDKGRFLTAAIGIIGRRLTYKKLIGADDAAGLQSIPA